jgi:hypothetical protein
MSIDRIVPADWVSRAMFYYVALKVIPLLITSQVEFVFEPSENACMVSVPRRFKDRLDECAWRVLAEDFGWSEPKKGQK